MVINIVAVDWLFVAALVVFLTFFKHFFYSVYTRTRTHTHTHTHSLPVIQACSWSSLIFILVTWWTLQITPCDWFYDNNPDCFRRAWLMETWESIIQQYVTTTASLIYYCTDAHIRGQRCCKCIPATTHAACMTCACAPPLVCVNMLPMRRCRLW